MFTRSPAISIPAPLLLTCFTPQAVKTTAKQGSGVLWDFFLFVFTVLAILKHVNMKEGSMIQQ